MHKDFILFGKKIKQEQILPLLAVVFSVGMIFLVIFPQINEFGQLRSVHGAKQEEITQYERSLATLTQASPDTLNQDYSVVEHALPAEKDIISIFSTVSLLAADAELQIQGFVMKVGDYYSTPGDEDDADRAASPTLDVTLQLSSQNEDQVASFIDQVYKSLPLAKINSVRLLNNETSIELSFYYQALNLESIKNSDVIVPYESQNSKLIQDLRQWGQ
jgi:hypothetical protein